MSMDDKINQIHVDIDLIHCLKHFLGSFICDSTKNSNSDIIHDIYILGLHCALILMTDSRAKVGELVIFCSCR